MDCPQEDIGVLQRLRIQWFTWTYTRLIRVSAMDAKSAEGYLDSRYIESHRSRNARTTRGDYFDRSRRRSRWILMKQVALLRLAATALSDKIDEPSCRCHGIWGRLPRRL
jgi:hypothetical protein